MHLIKTKKDGQPLPLSLPPGALPGPASGERSDACTSISPDSSQHLRPISGLAAASLHTPSLSEDRSRLSVLSVAAPSGLRSSRSTPHLSGSALTSQPSNTLSLAPSTPFPMSPLPTGVMTTTYIPSHPTNPEQWNIEPEERARYDRFFDQLDAQRKGYLLSDVAVPFFGRAKLPNDIMATIW